MSKIFSMKAVTSAILMCAASALQATPLYSITPIPGYGGYFTAAWGLNNSGTVVGTSGRLDYSSAAYTFTNGSMVDLGSIGGLSAEGAAINQFGQATGAAYTAQGPRHAYLYTNGAMLDLGTLGGSESFGTAVNSAGHVVGNSQVTSGSTRAFLYDGSTMQSLGTLGGSTSYAYGINDAGAVVGYASTPGDNFGNAYIWQNGVMTNLGVLPGGYLSIARAINSAGQITGLSSAGDGNTHVFIVENGVMRDLGSMGGRFAAGSSINNLGQVVGSFSLTGSAMDGRAFFYDGAAMFDLNNLLQPQDQSSWLIASASGINDLGQITVDAYWNGERTAALLTPLSAIPEPSTFLLFLGALTCGFVVSQRRNLGQSLSVLASTDRLNSTS